MKQYKSTDLTVTQLVRNSYSLKLISTKSHSFKHQSPLLHL